MDLFQAIAIATPPVNIGCVWYADGTGRNECVIFEKNMGYICLKMVKHCVPQTWNKPVPGGEVGRKNTQNLSRRTARSTHFWRTKRGTERLVPFRPVPSHVPNAPIANERLDRRDRESKAEYG
ncbi:hypothetical protein DVH24_029300 [Malus domestica]|uniref:Uncharacterized protein n=1 Tax=Malus domestica TaxID=3750 RepID=A0A498HV94_MALDO|nr:hypothetical protein DVH24_029300 [Malus domestica]